MHGLLSLGFNYRNVIRYGDFERKLMYDSCITYYFDLLRKGQIMKIGRRR